MNKFKKTAIAITSVVMAGSMVFGLVGCGGGSGDDDDATLTYNPSGVTYSSATSAGSLSLVSLLKGTYGLSDRVTANAGAWTTAKSYWAYLSSDSYSSSSSTTQTLSYTDNTVLNIAIGYNSPSTGAFYSGITGNTSVPGGYTASSGTIKPAFKAIQDALKVSFVDKYSGDSTSKNLTNLVTSNAWGDTVDIATTDLSVAVEQSSTYGNVLNLADYLDYMPNFKAFLEANPVVYLSLLQSGWDTTDSTSSQSILVAPYFDGNDDIERYCLIRQDWVEDLLDGDLSSDGDSYVKACGTVAASGWMGTSGSYTVETSKEDGSGDTFTLKKDYDAAKTAAADTTTALGAAYYDIAGIAYAGSSGNIVDIMNEAINAAGDATGKQLATLYRAYIDVAYTNSTASTAAYTTRSDLFNGYSAAWDVDDLVAMLRIVKTNSQNVGLDSLTTQGIFPRDATNDRTPDMVRLAAQLYGERGADSRYEYTYIDSDGNLQDARENASFYQALENFGCLASEGLVVAYVDSDGNQGSVSGTTLKGNCTSSAGTGFMMYDYSQTQTSQMFDLSSSSPDTDYLFAAINTPVSRWDVDGDGNKTDIMRFTESWRSTKTSGICLSSELAKNENKLHAALAFVDYLYSNDGQILSTYGVQSTSGNTNPNGTWYGTKVTTTETTEGLTVNGTVVATKVGGQYVVKDEYESQYFCFGDELYTGTLYKGKMTPTVTTELYNDFLSTTSETYTTFKQRGSFTGYARAVLGATLPMGVKDQSFENQLTATEAAAEATKVSVSLSNGTIKHVTLEIDSDNYWYTTVPTSLPLSTAQSNTINHTNQANLKYMTGTVKGSDKNFYSIFHYIIFFGYTGTYNQQSVVVQFS